MQWHFLKEEKWCLQQFESGIFSRLNESDQSEQSSDDVKYNLFGYDAYKLSKKLKDVSLENILSGLIDFVSIQKINYSL